MLLLVQLIVELLKRCHSFRATAIFEVCDISIVRVSEPNAKFTCLVEMRSLAQMIVDSVGALVHLISDIFVMAQDAGTQFVDFFRLGLGVWGFFVDSLPWMIASCLFSDLTMN